MIINSKAMKFKNNIYNITSKKNYNGILNYGHSRLALVPIKMVYSYEYDHCQGQRQRQLHDGHCCCP